MTRTVFRQLYFCPISTTHLTRLQEQQKDDANGNESAFTQLESELASSQCTKKSARSCSQLEQRVSLELEEHSNRGSKFENQICDRICEKVH